MSSTIKTISDLNEGDTILGVNSDDYSIVKKCVHGNLYYAYINTNDFDIDCIQDDVILVSDDDEHTLDCCN